MLRDYHSVLILNLLHRQPVLFFFETSIVVAQFIEYPNDATSMCAELLKQIQSNIDE